MNIVNTFVAILCIITYFNSSIVAKSSLACTIIGCIESFISVSRQFTYLFWSSLWYFRRAEFVLYQVIFGPISFVLLAIEWWYLFDYIWEYYLIFSLYNCILIGFPYYFMNREKCAGQLSYKYYKLLSFIYLVYYFHYIFPSYVGYFVLSAILLVDCIRYKTKSVKRYVAYQFGSHIPSMIL